MNRQSTAENIRAYRIKCRMTQKALAGCIGYSEKTVSKWERGDAQPDVETLMRLAEVFGIDMNTLTGFSLKVHYYLGIDGGATKTAFVLCDEDGHIVSSVSLSSCNPVDVGLDRAAQVLKDGIVTVCRGIPLGTVSAYAGLSGGTAGDNKERIARFLSDFSFAKYGCGSDTDNAVAVSLGKSDGIAAIMGTGSVVIAVKDGQRHRFGGYGCYFDDGGSGFDIGRECLLRCLKARDGSGKPTALLDPCEEKLGMTALEALGTIYREGKAYVASFAPMVYEAYRKGDAVAEEILQKSMKRIAENLNAAAAYFNQEPVTAHLVGGQCADADVFLPILRGYLDNNITAAVCDKPQYIGALRMGGLEKEIIL